MAELIEVPPAILPEVVDRLTEKRMAVEKEVSMIGEAPSSLKDVFELCRGFEKAFQTALNSKNITQNDTPTAAKIKESFNSEKGLAGQICKLQLDDLFKLDNVKKICKQADGYQPHLVSPENGLRLLATEALTRVNGPVQDCIHHVYRLLVDAARDAAAQAGAYVDGVSPGIKEPIQVPAFKTMILPAVQKALEDWRKEAETMALMLVDMERSYISSGFFRTTMGKRVTKAQQAAKTAAAPPKPTPTSKITGVASTIRNRFARNNKQDHDDDDDDSTYSAPSRTSASGSSRPEPSSVDAKNDLVAAYFEKSQSTDGGFLGRGWQKRFFIFKHSQKTLYYFKSAEDVQKPDGLKGSVVLTECVVEDIDEKGQVRTRISPESVFIRVRHRDPSRAAVKDNNSLVLKADRLETKEQWLAMLQRATGYNPKPEAAEPSPRDARSRRNSADEEEEPAEEAEEDQPEEQEDDDPAASWEPYSFDNGTFDARMGEGAPIFRAENYRDPEGRLLPAPIIVLNPKEGDVRRSMETQEARYDMVLHQFGEDMSVYIRMVCDTIVNTVPKAVIHGLVKRAEGNILNRLFAHVHALSEPEMQRLLEEDDGTKKRREAARRSLEEISKALEFVHHLQGEVAMAANKDGPKKERVTIQAMYIAYSGLVGYLPRDKQAQYRRILDDPHAPKVLKEEYIPKTQYAPSERGSGSERPQVQSSQSLRRPSVSVAPGGRPGEPLRRPPPPPPGMR